MMEQYPYETIIGISLLLGGIPFAFLALNYYDGVGLSRVFSRKFLDAVIFENNWFSFFLIALGFLMDFIKIAFLVKLSDSLLGRSDISLIVPVLFCFVSGFVIYSLVLRKTELSFIAVWGAIFFLSPKLSIFLFFIALVLFFITGKQYVSRYLIVLVAFIWFLASGALVSSLYVVLLATIYIFINNILYAGKNKTT